jgi:serine protease DegS
MSKSGHSAIFITASVLCGVLAALLLIWLWPELISRPVSQASNGRAGQATGPAGATGAENGAGDPGARNETLRDALPAGGLLEQSDGGSFAPAVRRSAPAVVSIYTRRMESPAADPPRQGAPVRPRFRHGLGSGVIVDAAGHIITNEHVIRNSQQIRVQLADGREAGADVVGLDRDTDLAVLKIDLPELPVMQLGRSDRVSVGDVVLAIGNPLGLSQTVTAGIVSATGRADLGVATFEDFIQTDAAINVGNSGGALVNARGELIGINTAVVGRNFDAEGIGVAIPVDMVRGVMQEILTNGRVTRGWLGLVLEDVPEEYARIEGLAHGGVVIISVQEGSPARRARLVRGDVIETIDGTAVRSARDTLARIASRKPGSRLKLVVMRGPERITTDLEVAESAPG